MVSGKRYLTIMAFFISFIFFIVAAINYIVDPYWRFNFAPSNVIVGLNHQISALSLVRQYPTAMVERQQKMLQQAAFSTALIGTSRSLYGINTCNYNEVQKAGLLGITAAETLQLFETTLNTPDFENVFIELGSLNDNTALEPNQLTHLKALFSTRVLVNSLSNVSESWHATGQRQPLCSTQNKTRNPLFGGRDDSVAQDYSLSSIEQVIADMALRCSNSTRTSINPLNVVIFIAPVHHSLVDYKTLQRINRALGDFIGKQHKRTQCAIHTYIFEQDSADLLQENWFDSGHYKPLIGNRFFGNMFSKFKAKEFSL